MIYIKITLPCEENGYIDSASHKIENMKKKFVIQNAIDKKYWYGFYTNKNWTDDILEARLFENKQEMEDWIENNIGELEGMFLVAIEVWY